MLSDDALASAHFFSRLKSRLQQSKDYITSTNSLTNDFVKMNRAKLLLFRTKITTQLDLFNNRYEAGAS